VVSRGVVGGFRGNHNLLGPTRYTRNYTSEFAKRKGRSHLFLG